VKGKYGKFYLFEFTVKFDTFFSNSVTVFHPLSKLVVGK